MDYCRRARTQRGKVRTIALKHLDRYFNVPCPHAVERRDQMYHCPLELGAPELALKPQSCQMVD